MPFNGERPQKQVTLCEPPLWGKIDAQDHASALDGGCTPSLALGLGRLLPLREGQVMGQVPLDWSTPQWTANPHPLSLEYG